MRDYLWVTEVLVDLARYCSENELSRTAEQVRFAEDTLTEELYLTGDSSLASLPQFRSSRRDPQADRAGRAATAPGVDQNRTDAIDQSNVVHMTWRSCRAQVAS